MSLRFAGTTMSLKYDRVSLCLAELFAVPANACVSAVDARVFNLPLRPL